MVWMVNKYFLLQLSFRLEEIYGEGSILGGILVVKTGNCRKYALNSGYQASDYLKKLSTFFC